jgi:HAD superfamily hydrolase (TIGR01509 family)
MATPRSLRTLLLDAGGVLVVPNWERVSTIFAAHGLSVPPDTLRRVEPAVKFDIDRVIASTRSDAGRTVDYFDGVLDRAGVPPSPARDRAVADVRAYHADTNLWETVLTDVIPALDRLRGLGLTLAVASNANGTVGRAMVRLGLAPYFDVICDSFEEGVEKPDPRFFRVVLERAGGRPETTLHVGDLYHVDVVGARSAGLHAMLIDRDEMYDGFDVERVRDLGELADRIMAWAG